MTVFLPHAHDDCTGRWGLVADERGTLYVCCDTCLRCFPATARNKMAAIEENFALLYLRRLADEGAALMGRD